MATQPPQPVTYILIFSSGSVANILVDKGVSRESMEVTSYGNKYQLIKRLDGVAEPASRRVEITVR
jgi:outer membrane protein OmpA-like peptidoglycan-associated protein